MVAVTTICGPDIRPSSVRNDGYSENEKTMNRQWLMTDMKENETKMKDPEGWLNRDWKKVDNILMDRRMYYSVKTEADVDY